jgi:translation initiation factor IF-2
MPDRDLSRSSRLMADKRTPPADVLGSLPRSRPHRRSEKRAAPAAAKPAAAAAKPAAPRSAAAKPAAARRPARPQPPQPGGVPRTPPRDPGASASRTDLLGTAVQAAAELAEVGLSAGARALRQAVSRLPRP